MDEKETVQLTDSERPKEKKKDWGTSSCPLFIFGDDDAAEYDMNAIKQFFSRFKKKAE